MQLTPSFQPLSGRRVAAVALALACAVAGVVAIDGGSSWGSTDRCSARHSKTVAKSQLVRVYKEKQGDSNRGFGLLACEYKSGRTVALDAPGDGSYAFLPPAVSISRTVVGYGVQYCDTATDQCNAVVAGVDVAKGAYHQTVRRYTADPPNGDSGLVKVGSLRMKRSGSVAWITCPEHSGEPFRIVGSQRPNCVTAGDRDEVFKLEKNGNWTLLDHGRHIDPRSLRRSGSRLTWLHRKRPRHATLK